jgi:hypothetical protein
MSHTNSHNEKKSRQSTLKRWKTCNEIEVLEKFFNLDKEWNRKTMVYVKDLVSLTEEQIYKWGYEKKRKLKLLKSKKNRKVSLNSMDADQDSVKTQTDYNSLIDELFPDSENLADTLTLAETVRYDALKAEILENNSSFKEMSDLDQLLFERMPISDVNLKSKRQVKEMKKDAFFINTTFEVSERLDKTKLKYTTT